MTNQNKLFFFLFLFIPCFLFGQNQGFFHLPESKIVDHTNIIVSYILEYREDSTNTEHVKENEMLLFVGDSISMFMSYNSAYNDTLIKEQSKHFQNNISEYKMYKSAGSSGLMKTRFRYRIYKNYPDKTITFQEHLLDGPLYYQEPAKNFKWSIDQSYLDSFGRFSVKKARTYYGGRNWVAWFTPDIPVSDGPYKFHGLPGLILRLKDTQNHYSFTFKSITSIDKSRPIEWILYERLTQTTRTDFLKAQKNFRNNIINHAQEAHLPLESQIRAAETLRHRNNPIELKAE